MTTLDPPLTKPNTTPLSDSFLCPMKTFSTSSLLPSKHRSALSALKKHPLSVPFRIFGGRGSLKTQFCLTAALLSLSNTIGDVIFVSPSPSFAYAVQEQFRWILDHIHYASLFSSTNKRFFSFSHSISHKTLYIFPATNSQLVSRFLSHPHTSLVIIDDAQRVSLNIIQSFSNFSSSKCILSANPYESPRPSFSNGFDPIDLLRLSIPHFRFSYLDVPISWLGKSFFSSANLLKQSNPTLFAHEYLAINSPL